jgi:hypothetical protein
MDGCYDSMPSIGQRNQRLKVVLISLACIIGLIFLYAINPSTSSVFPPCPFHALTGLHCPGCGSLRAMHQLLHGHVLTAFGLNPLMVLTLPFLGYAFLSEFLEGLIGIYLPRPFIPASWIWAYLAVILLFWALRNVPVYPFTLLAP